MRSIFALCCLFLFAVPAVAQSKPADFAELEKIVEAELKENKTPGAAIVVEEPVGRVVIARESTDR